jgi:S-adenosylmethionine:tRNA ribosyltransferase-isomerase
MSALAETAPEPARTLDFELPRELEAHEPPEASGRARDDVRMLVAERASGAIAHRRLADLPEVLRAGDLVVVNTSATLPASLDAVRSGGDHVELHLSTQLPAGPWIVELRRPAPGGSRPMREAVAGEELELPGGGRARLAAPFPLTATETCCSRLWLAGLDLPGPLRPYLARHGQPIAYGGGPRWPIAAYQTVFATEPGSAEMPSAGRPFTSDLVTALVTRGIDIAPIVLHTGVSSLEDHELPYPERYRVPGDTARRANAARAAGGRLIAIGTTVIRALETVADERGELHPGEGWSELAIDPGRGVRAIDGMLSGWHEPRASHLLMLEAVAGRSLLERSYAAALEARYRWHEFGDVHLIL